MVLIEFEMFAVELNEWLFEVLMCKLGYEHKFLLHFDRYYFIVLVLKHFYSTLFQCCLRR